MAESLSPFVYWGQNSNTIFLKIDIKEPTTPEVQLNEDDIKFRGNGIGSQGRNEYSFEIRFYLPIEHKKSKYRIGERSIEFQLQKVGRGECWPRLTYDQKKPAWLKIDFDHFSYDDSEEEPANAEDEQMEEKRMMEKLEKDLKSAETTAFSDLKSFYLFVYNMFMWVGFSSVFGIISYRYFKLGEASKTDVFPAVGPQLMVCQLAAIMEIIHPMLGLVKTGPFMPLIQVFGRNLVLFGLIAPEKRLHERHIIWWLFLTWAAVEVIRYPFYMLSIVNMQWKLVTWLRYTAWIPLYPIGFICEGFVMILALPLFEQTGKWTVELPNAANMSFHFPTFLRIYMLAFLAGMYFLMNRMYLQRKVKLPPGGIRGKTRPAPRGKAKTA